MSRAGTTAVRSAINNSVYSAMSTALTYAIPLGAAAVSIAPFLFMLLISLEHHLFVSGNPATWVPLEPTLSTYAEVVRSSRFARWMFNSLFVALAVTAGVLLIHSMAGYAFAKKRFAGRDRLFVVVLAGLMVPGAMTLIPTFLIARELGMLNAYSGLTIPAPAAPLGVFLMRQYIISIPSELIDAARIHGCREFGIYWRVIMPLSLPGLATLGIITFTGQWRDLLWPLIVASDDAMKTLPVGLAGFATQFRTDYGVQMAGALLSVLPVMVVFLALQRYFIRGLSEGALKG